MTRSRRILIVIIFRSFLLSNEGTTERILVYCTAEFLTYLSQSPKIFMDGTFKSSPNLFYQIYTIHGYFRDTQLVPFVYAFLPNKERITYERLFKVILEKVSMTCQE